MGRRLRLVLLPLIGAVLLGTVGLVIGSWFGGRDAPRLGEAQAESAAAELLPGVELSETQFRNGHRFGIFLAENDFGSGDAEFQYDETAGRCSLSEQLRRNAAARGWRDLRRVPGDLCDGWRAERDGVAAVLTHEVDGSRLRVTGAPPDGFWVAVVIGTILGAAAGAALYLLVARLRPPLPVLIGTVVAIGLLPGVAITWVGLAVNRLAEPVWPLWVVLSPLLVTLWLALVTATVIILVQHRKGTRNR